MMQSIHSPRAPGELGEEEEVVVVNASSQALPALHPADCPGQYLVTLQRFARKSHVAHERSHTGEKPYACSMCCGEIGGGGGTQPTHHNQPRTFVLALGERAGETFFRPRKNEKMTPLRRTSRPTPARGRRMLDVPQSLVATTPEGQPSISVLIFQPPERLLNCIL